MENTIKEGVVLAEFRVVSLYSYRVILNIIYIKLSKAE